MLVTNQSKRVEIPHEKDEWMEFRKLSWRQMEIAEEIQTDLLLKRMKSMGADMVKALRDAVKGKEEQDPFKRYDKSTVLDVGIVKWSYEAEITKENIETLDEVTADWAFKEILSLNKTRTDEEVKNA